MRTVAIFLKRNISWRWVGLLFVLLVSLMGVSNMIDSPRGRVGHSPPVWVGLEKRSADEIYLALDAYGESGRQAIKEILVLDSVYALVWPLLLGSVIYLSYRKVRASNPWLLRILLAIPLVGLLLDEVQNLAIARLLAYYPQRLNSLAELSSYLSIGLWTCIFVSLLAAIIGLAIYGTKRSA